MLYSLVTVTVGGIALILVCCLYQSQSMTPPVPVVNVKSAVITNRHRLPPSGDLNAPTHEKNQEMKRKIKSGKQTLKDWTARKASEKRSNVRIPERSRSAQHQLHSPQQSVHVSQLNKQEIPSNVAQKKRDLYQKVMAAGTENKTKILHGIARKNPMIYLEGETFKMGVNDPSSKTGEYPVRSVAVRPFRLDRYPVTNGDFMVFKRKKIRYKTTAEKAGFSWVFFTDKSRNASLSYPARQPTAPWWYGVKDAYWKQPGGEGSDVMAKLFYPVVHVSYFDAHAFCTWAGKRLPTEYEWEYAVRGGLKGLRYPWGDKFKRNRANLWQGLFPAENHKVDGHYSLAPVNAYESQNNYGFYDMLGNAWEWTPTVYTEPRKPVDLKDKRYVVKGGSFIDSRDGKFNHEARCAARLGLRPNYTAGNVGFRCAKTVMSHETSPKSEEVPTTTQRSPKHHKYEDTWAYKVKQIVQEVWENIKDPARLQGEL